MVLTASVLVAVVSAVAATAEMEWDSSTALDNLAPANSQLIALII